jgi:membrane-bound lytic murein transglycosylase A
MKKHYLLLAGLGAFFLFFEILTFVPSSKMNQASLIASKAVEKENITKSGKEKRTHQLSKLYNKSIPLFSPLDDEDLLPLPTERLGKALVNQKRLLKYTKNKTYYSDDDLTITKNNLEETVALLQKWNNEDANLNLGDLFETYLLKGRDKKGNVKFTGYYSPIIDVSETRTEDFQFPIYKKPNKESWEGYLPTRYEIQQGALAGRGLELAWAKSPSDVRALQLQGSGYVKFPDGNVEYFQYGGSNGRTAANTLPAQKVNLSPSKEVKSEKTYRKPNYIFFKRVQKSSPIGAGSVPLTPEVSIAVDPRFIPLGAALLVEFPVINSKGRLLRHEYRILMAQDTGGAIKGAGKIDYYTGIGETALAKARYMSHYGRVWLLMPKG